MKNYVQYHNAAKQGPLRMREDGKFQIFAKKSIKHLMSNKVWLISGEGISSPKRYKLEYCFTVDEVIDGMPNLAVGSSGTRPLSGIPLNHYPWFRDFKISQQNFSLGVREIPDEYLREFEKLITKYVR